MHPVWRHFADASTMSSLESNRSYRPLLPLTLSLSYALHGLSVWGYHLFNLVAHLLASTVLYFCFVRLLAFREPAALPRARVLAALAAGLFVVHPIAGMTVNYPSGRDNLMLQLFLAASLLWYVRLRQEGDRPILWLGALAAYAAALLSKTPALVFPLVVALFELVVVRPPARSPRSWLRPLAFAAVGGLYLAAARLVPRSGEEQLGPWTVANVASFAGTQLKLHLVYYARNVFYPFELRGLPSWEPVTSPADAGLILGALFFAGSWVLAWRLRRRSPPVTLAIGAYWIMFAPTSSVVPLAQWVGDRWMYPSLPYLALALAVGLGAVVRRPARAWVVAVLCAYFVGASLYLNTHWRTPLAFYAQSARYGTDAIGYMNLGLQYLPTDRAKAKRYFDRSLEIAPYYHYAHINLGLWYVANGEAERGVEQARRAVGYAPANARTDARYWLGIVLLRAGRAREAVPELVRAWEAEPLRHDRLHEAATAAYAAGDLALAARLFERLHASVPNVALSRFMAGWIAWSRGDVEGAIREYRLAIRHAPDHAQTWFNLGVALERQGACAEAVEAFTAYLRFFPENRAARERIDACRSRRRS